MPRMQEGTNGRCKPNEFVYDNFMQDRSYEIPRFTGGTLALLLLVLGCAGGARAWYVANGADHGRSDPAIQVQGRWPDDDKLLANYLEERWFGCKAPLAKDEERTAHVAPGYPMFLSACAWRSDSPDRAARWLQCVLGTLTAGCLFFFALDSFHNLSIATVAGVLYAFHPFAILATAEINDGTLISFLVAASLALGTRCGQTGGALTSLGFGIALAGVALTRAALLPFALLSLLWMLWQCRTFPLGWFAGFLAVLGFVNGLAPWAIRNYQAFERPIPVASSTYLHLWIGNHPHATGSTISEQTLRETFSNERRQTLLDEPDQTLRYNQLSIEFWQEVRDHPGDTLARRIQAAFVYLFGDRWFKHRQLAQVVDHEDVGDAPSWLHEHLETILHAVLLAIFVLAVLGWRWSYPWRRQARLGAIAIIFLPLPYVLSHAEHLSGPRSPLDGVLLSYAAFALVSLIPGFVKMPKAAAKARREKTA